MVKFLKKIHCIFCYISRGGVRRNVTNVTLSKVVQYLATDFSNSKSFYKCFDFSGGQKFSLKKNTLYFRYISKGGVVRRKSEGHLKKSVKNFI